MFRATKTKGEVLPNETTGCSRKWKLVVSLEQRQRRKIRAVSWQQSWMQWSESPASIIACVPFRPPHLCSKRSCVRCKSMGHVLCQWQREPTAKCLSAWQRRDLFLLQVVIQCPQYCFAVIRYPGTARETEPYCASCFLKYKTRESHPFDYLTLVNVCLCFQKRN